MSDHCINHNFTMENKKKKLEKICILQVNFILLVTVNYSISV